MATFKHCIVHVDIISYIVIIMEIDIAKHTLNSEHGCMDINIW